VQRCARDARIAHDRERSIDKDELRTLRLPTKDGELLSKREVLGDEARPGAEGRPERADDRHEQLEHDRRSARALTQRFFHVQSVRAGSPSALSARAISATGLARPLLRLPRSSSMKSFAFAVVAVVLGREVELVPQVKWKSSAPAPLKFNPYFN
jgi:hypothetical protein